MRVAIQTWGSDGDIRPLIALGGGLSARGHSVTIAVTSVDDKDYAPLCSNLGIDYLSVPSEPFGCDLTELIERIGKTGNSMKMLKVLLDNFFFPFVEEMYSSAARMCADSDIAIGHFLLYPLRLAALKSDMPYLSVMYWPGLVPSAFQPPERLPNLGKPFNRAGWWLVEKIVGLYLRKEIIKLWKREMVHFPKAIVSDVFTSKTLNLLAVSPSLWQRQPDWRPWHRICGFFAMPSSAEPWEPPSSLSSFIDAGPAPLFMTLGTAQQALPEQSIRLMTAAANSAGHRAIVHTTSPRYPENTEKDGIYFVCKVPHERVFPHCSAVVHHGGAGTTHTAARCGCPSVVLPLSDEQFSWGMSLYRCGVAPRPLWLRKANQERLAERIRTVENAPKIRERAAALADQMQNEHGVHRAVRYIERVSYVSAKRFASM